VTPVTEKTEMNAHNLSREVTLTRMFDAPRDLVFAAWTDPKHIAKWFGPHAFTIPECRVDLRVGGRWHLVMRANDEVAAMMGRDHPCGGEYVEIVPPERLSFTNNALDDKGNVILEGFTTVQFEDIGGKTKLTLTTRASGSGDHVSAMLAGMEQGWSESLDKLAKLFDEQE
jgi:uncharacterized protein YndB with AHSA1/START domain